MLTARQRWHVWGYRQGNTESKRSRYPCLAALNAHAPGKQRCLRLKPVFSVEKTKWFRWVTWGMSLSTVTGSWTHLMFVRSLKSTSRLCLIPHSILRTGQIWPFPSFVSPFCNLYNGNSRQNRLMLAPFSNQKLPLALLLTLYLPHIQLQTEFASGSL